MFQPLPCFIGLRYLRSRRRRRMVSFMSSASLISIMLGVAALIVILSVMNGFETELRTRLLSMNAHLTVADPEAGLGNDWPLLQARLREQAEVVGVAPFVQLEGMLAAGAGLRPALIRGILPDEEAEISDLSRFLAAGSLDLLQPGTRHIVLGRLLALNLGVDVGQRVNVLVPRIDKGRPAPRLAAFVVAGIFEAGIVDNDANLALVHLEDASVLSGLEGRPEGLSVKLSDPLLAPMVQKRLAATSDLEYSNWTEEHASIFRAIRIEKVMMTIILLFIVAVAAFNIVASLMMVVIDKETDIAILRTCGIEPRQVSRVFFVQGSVIGLMGAGAGTLLGLLLAANVGTIVPWLESTFGFQIMPGDLYYVTAIPSEIHAGQVALIPFLALTFALLATLYPARRAARIAPAQVLRYD